MEVYIDNKKVNMNIKKFSSFGLAISEINKGLSKENKILEEILVNGEALKDNSIITLDDHCTLEITTRSCGSIIIESLFSAKEHIDEYFAILDSFYDDVSDEDNIVEIDEFDIIELMFFLRWFDNLLLVIKENGQFDFFFDDYKEFVDNFHEQLIKCSSYLDENRIDELLAEFEYTMGDMLDKFYENIEEYLDHVIMDEKMKKLLN